ncbi:hypothetical protein SERLADRAFT_443105 [Serpula lacrymans var. lacrymans S7.9]|uniref:Uncharacterized protein n=1 Tax=Serpula lacrymans var. lacrymans (strain S7.9) TaxID=578457 RepID=F8PBJ7_SERL9|nr:uncharacterized protein SERLADRAFT_443105 [Serpula lacrymans var. lacrymans S7.9]EGO19635.1 hypothetical protein SERLADRAFT_443105 [Serpula lacrymans var. lacrymans S7.9]
MSHLRVWGYTAYVHVQKDKRGVFGSHMEKCVFIFSITEFTRFTPQQEPLKLTSQSPLLAIFTSVCRPQAHRTPYSLQVQKETGFVFVIVYRCLTFIGYPAGYKGWKFYNPERADFDECYFPGLKKTSTTAIPTPPFPPLLPMPLGLDEDVLAPGPGGDIDPPAVLQQPQHLPDDGPDLDLDAKPPVNQPPELPDYPPHCSPSPDLPIALRRHRVLLI